MQKTDEKEKFFRAEKCSFADVTAWIARKRLVSFLKKFIESGCSNKSFFPEYVGRDLFFIIVSTTF